MKSEDLTAWALNELSAKDRAQVEAQLQDSHELQSKARDTKAFCALLTEQLGDVDQTLTSAQRQALLASVPGNVVAFDATATASDPSVTGFRARENVEQPTKSFAEKKLLRSGVKGPSYGWPLRIAALAACAVGAMFVIQQSGVLSTTEVDFLPSGATLTQGDDVAVHQIQQQRRVIDTEIAKVLKPKPLEVAKVDSFGVTVLPHLKADAPSTGSIVVDANKLPALGSPASATVMTDGANLGKALALQNETGGLPADSGKLYFKSPASAPVARRASSSNQTLIAGSGTLSGGAGSLSTVTENMSFNETAATGTPPSPVPGQLRLSGGITYTGRTVQTASKPQSENQESKDGAGRLSLMQVNELRQRMEVGRGLLKETIVAIKEGRQIPQSRTSTERDTAIHENSFLTVASEPLSTFSIDVDTASYANVRRFLNQGSLPPPDAVRLEELINYFPYHYEAPAKDAVQPFSVQVDLAESPWTPEHRIARIGIKGKDIGLERVPANFVFLVDVSGSMSDENKLPLVKRSLLMLTEQLEDNDRVALVTYAGESGVALESTVGKERAKITAAIFAMNSGGSTNGASGIELAYAEAQKHFIKEGVNRVILCTDGDFNVGISSPEALEKLIKQKAQGGVFLSVLGYGQGNLQDRTMETLADKGNGNYAYIDSLSEARKVLVEQMHGTLVTIAKDVKIQVEFNPSVVRAYRLLGYENRVLAAQDFNNDRKDAGEIGAGHTVTALYEIVTVDAPMPPDRPLVDDLKYQPKAGQKELPAMASRSPLPKLEGINDELMTVKLRYKSPDGDLSKLIEVPVKDAKTKIQDAPKDFQFAAAVTGFGLMLRDSEHKGSLTWEEVHKLAIAGKGEDRLGYRGEFIQLIDKANGLGGRP